MDRIIELLEDNNLNNSKQDSLILWELQENRKRIDIIKNASTSKIYEEVNIYLKEKQLSMKETLEYIEKNKLSFSRFGDGELKLMLRNDYNLKFQKNSENIQVDLKNCLNSKVENLLIGFSNVYHDLHWASVYADIWFEIKPMLINHNVFGHAHVSRPLFFLTMGQDGVDLWRKIWDDKDITIITGQSSRFDAIDALFDNAKTINYMYSVPKNAYDDLPRILDEIQNNQSELFLISLGPAGTILTFELAKLGKWAIDIGHINSSYENVFEDKLWPEKLKIKIEKQ
ncbi:GT-D fold domain-containing glycosyltransferase [Mycoplasma sp. P36-A1]|uniref:GT-D fold domain-containing glycosyltransferase n=1 Tax=Mycoplasma sp. P36-A1 TaxID=3252900 RepID=UPI003C2C271E